MPEPVDEVALVEHVASAIGLIIQPVVSAAGDPAKGWALFMRAVDVVRERMANEGLLPLRKKFAKVENLAPEPTGIVAIKHGLGSERVSVKLFSASGKPRAHRRLGVPISEDEVEVIAESTDIAYAEVHVIGE